ncbi:MAG: sugar phosphate isomerase/epimerase family protein [Candidatus Hodarchaeota archaeon]
MLGNIGIAIMVEYELGLLDFLRKTNRSGISYVEFRCERPIFYPGDLDFQRRSRLRRVLENLSITPLIHAPFQDVNLASLNPLKRRASVTRLKECIELANDINAELVVVHPGHLPKDHPESMLSQSRLNLIDSIGDVIEIAEGFDITLALENTHKGVECGVIRFPEDYFDIIGRFDSPYLKAAFDVGHANTFNMDLGASILKISGYLVNIHIHDNDGKSDRHLPVGEGIIDFGYVLEVLKKLDYKGPLIIENATLEDAIKSRKRLDEIWNSL